MCFVTVSIVVGFFFFQAEDGIRDLVRSRGLGDVYKRQPARSADKSRAPRSRACATKRRSGGATTTATAPRSCLLYTSDAADERSSVDLGGRRIIKKKKHENNSEHDSIRRNNKQPDYRERKAQTQ